MDVLPALLGLLVVGTVLADVIATLIVTVPLHGRIWPSRLYYDGSWAFLTGFVRRLPSQRIRHRLLTAYAPASVLGLLMMWLLGLLAGWALVLVPLQGSLDGADDLGDVIYYAGVTLLTIGFGDVVPESGLTRVISLASAITGLGTLAAVLSYLPSLYTSYSRRESKLLTLDDADGQRVDPVGLIALHAPDGEVRDLYAFFREWEQWGAEVLESHSSYPMLALFRSHEADQHWVTGLGVVLDAAALTSACVEGADRRAPLYCYRRLVRALAMVDKRFGDHPEPAALVQRDRFAIAYRQLAELELPLREPREAWRRFVELRQVYGSMLDRLMVRLLAPMGFWGHSADVDPVDPSMEQHDDVTYFGLALSASGEERAARRASDDEDPDEDLPPLADEEEVSSGGSGAPPSGSGPPPAGA